MGFETNTGGWEIRAAHDRELAAVRRMVPALYKTGSAPDRVLIATRARATEIVGVAAIAWRNWGKPPGFPVFVHVDESARRCGLGRALLVAAAQDCRSDIDRFYGWNAVEEASGEALFARAVGFEVSRRTLHYEADGLRFYAIIDRIHARLARNARIPADAATVPLASVPHAAVARLVSNTFGSRYDIALAATQGRGPGAYDADNSVVLLVGDEVQGAILYRWADGTPEIDVRVVAPHLQGGWANAALLHHATRNGWNAGARRFRFHSEDGNADTVSLARRTNASLLRTVLEFSAVLDALLQR